MKFKIKKLSLGTGRPIAFIHESKAKELNVHVGERVQISHNGHKIIAIVDIVKGIIKPNEISLSEEILSYLKPQNFVDVGLALEPKSTRLIFKKLKSQSLSRNEIYSIIKDIVNNALTEAEIAYFVSGVYENGMSLKETIYLTEAIFKTGKVLTWNSKDIVDKHSIGGIAGNRTTPIVVSICAAAGLIMPKTSSRSITSAAGTADVVETLARVDFSPSELKNIVNKTGACLAWGGSLGFAPADDKLIRVERLLGLDPESQLIASIIAKKLAVGSKYVLIDIPYGPQAKVNKAQADKLKKKFLAVAKHFKLKMRVVLTPGFQPIGNGIGPFLEMKDILRVLKRDNSPLDLEKKSIFLASQILEMTNKCPKGQGKILAQQILDSGQAFKKFNEIINAQGRKNSPLKLAKFNLNIKSHRSGKIKGINNRAINNIGRILGCPLDKAAGIYLYNHVGDNIKKGANLLTLYSESTKKMKEALEYYKEVNPISI